MPATYQMQDNDVIEIITTGHYDNSKILNVYHYKLSTGGAIVDDGAAMMIMIVEYLRDNALLAANGILSRQVGSFVHKTIKGQVVHPNRRYYYEDRTESGGVIGGTGCPSDVHLTVRKLTDRVGRGMSGNNKYTGLPVAQITGSKWQATERVAVQTAADLWATTFQPNAVLFPNVTLTPIVWSPNKGTLRKEIVSVLARDEVRVEPSRRFRLDF